MKTKTQGFTLIELLIVIAIIGLISTLATSSFRSARVKARDMQRIADTNNIRKALELYYLDKGYYPPSGCGWDCSSYYFSNAFGWTPLATELAPYIRRLPKDPINTGTSPWNGSFNYAYGNVGKTTYGHQYDLTTALEDPKHPERCGAKNWRFYFDDRAWCIAFGGIYSNQIYEASPD